MSEAQPVPSGPLPPSDWTFEQILWSAQHGLYWQVAATAIVLYDHATTLDLEIELIWKRKWSIVHALYFVNRYVGDAVLVHGTAYQLWLRGSAFDKGCKHGPIVQMALSMVSLWGMQSIIINRIWCMYRRSKKIIFLLVAAQLAEMASSLMVVAFSNKLVSMVVPFSPNFILCVPTGFSEWFWTFWCFILAFDSLIFILALWEGIRYFREHRAREALRRAAPQQSFINAISWPWMASQGSFVQVLVRDSILFPFLGLMGILMNLLAWFEVLPYGSFQITLVLSAVLSPVLGCRLILNLRDVYYQPFAAEFRPTLKSISEPRTPRSPSEQDFELPVRFARSYELSSGSIS